jgi:putative GTP pyrophosphokinase
LNRHDITMLYYDNLPLYDKLAEEANYILDEEIEEQQIKIHSISSRVKEEESFLQKVERKQSVDPFKDIKDLVGIRVVCLFLSDIKKIENIIKENFELMDEDNKISSNQLEFGYMSYHYIVKLKDEYQGPRYRNITDIPFEIQVRTISMDAWANISHYLDYKTDNDVPAELRKDFNAISGLFYVADTHFEMFYKNSQQNKIEIEEKVNHILVDSATEENEEINFDSLKFYLMKKFPDREASTDRSISQLVSELVKGGYHSINEIDKRIDSGLQAALQLEKDHPPATGVFNNVGIVRMLFSIIDDKYCEANYPEDKVTNSYYKKFIK